MFSEIEECIEKNTVNQSEMIHDVFLGQTPETRLSLLGRGGSLVEGFIPVTTRAKYVTINVVDRITPDYKRHQLILELFFGYDYEVFIHDPKYFIVNWIPVAFPFFYQSINVNKTIKHFFSMVMVEVEELDLSDDPCNTDEDYNFQVRVVQSPELRVVHRFPTLIISFLIDLHQYEPDTATWLQTQVGNIGRGSYFTSMYNYLAV